jgi:hypothetical protein
VEKALAAYLAGTSAAHQLCIIAGWLISFSCTLSCAETCAALARTLSFNRPVARLSAYCCVVCAADVAGLHCSCSTEGAAGFEVRVDGFSHKLGLLAGRVVDTLAGCKVRSALLAKQLGPSSLYVCCRKDLLVCASQCCSVSSTGCYKQARAD